MVSLLIFSVRIIQQNTTNSKLTNQLKVTAAKLNNLQNQDQYKINQSLKKNIDKKR